jgi:hypothetical protein
VAELRILQHLLARHLQAIAAAGDLAVRAEEVEFHGKSRGPEVRVL